MLRRWYIRTLLILALACCLTAWIGGYYRAFYIHHASSNLYVVGAFEGYLDFAYCTDPMSAPPWGFRSLKQRDHDYVQQEYADSQFHFVGFAFDHRHVALNVTALWIPLWFPTVVVAVLLFFSWRKPRLRSAATAFPIEPMAPKETA